MARVLTKAVLCNDGTIPIVWDFATHGEGALQ